MAVLSALKLVTATRTNAQDPVVLRREKLISKLQEQLNLVLAQQAGRTYTASRLKTVRDPETGERKSVEISKKVREWFWKEPNGSVNLSIRYGATTLYLNSKNATAIQVANMDELASVLKSLQTAIRDGEFDKAILEASNATREGFGK